MSGAIAAGAVALNLAGSFMPGTLPPEPPIIGADAAHAKLHRAWERMGTMKMIRPHLERHEGVYHTPTSATVSNQTAKTENWSGVTIIGNNSQYKNAEIAFSAMAPHTSYAFNSACPANPGNQAYTAAWAGVDGYGGSTVEQAGFQIVSNCDMQSSTVAWIETYPNPENVVTNFPISPGDMMDVFVWVDQATQATCAAWENESQDLYTTACLTAPGAFQAVTLEWVVERPQVGASLASLGNYVALPMWDALAWDKTTGQVFGGAGSEPSAWGSTGEFVWVSMMDNNGKIISVPNTRWDDTVIMYDEGSAYCAPGTTCEPRY